MADFTPLRPHIPFRLLRTAVYSKRLIETGRNAFPLLGSIRQLGVTDQLEDYEKRKLAIFNQLNFFQLITGTLIPLLGYLRHGPVAGGTWLIACLPAMISIIVLLLNARHKYDLARFSYFLFYPLFISVVYLYRLDLGVELSFILCGILSVFFLPEIGYMIFSISFSMVSYFVLFLIRKQNIFPPVPADELIYLANQVLTILYIFYALFLIMKENSGYQYNILKKNKDLEEKNVEIQYQQKLISDKAELLEKQASRLRESNRVKNKLFSIISHDLKAPIFALRNYFQHAAMRGLSSEELEVLMPEIIKDLNHSTILVENLLEWAKSQMKLDVAKPQKLDVSELAKETVQLMNLQFKKKKIQVITRTQLPAFAVADKDMIRLVLRNLLSNAIKFTPEQGKIMVSTSETSSLIHVLVKDSGKGISREELKKINKNEFYTTAGTQNETGTGLGLMLCKEFLYKNDSRLMIQSEPGQGSTFSFTLAAAS